MSQFIDYFINNSEQILSLFIDHIQMTGLAVVIALVIGVPLGIFISYYNKASSSIIGVANVFQAIPSMALLGLSIPIFGIGVVPATIVVVLYSLLPIIKNTYTGIMGIDENIIEAAQGIGLTKAQILTKVQIPMAMPVIMAGVRISAVTSVGLMTMAAFIGAGGLGFLVFSGINTMNTPQIVAGALPAAILALVVDTFFGFIEKIIIPTEDVGAIGSFIRRHKKIVIILLVLAMLVTFGLSFIDRSKDELVVAGVSYTEQYLLVHLLSDMIEDRMDIEVTRRDGLGGTQVAFNALNAGNIDLYVEYTGTIYTNMLNHGANSDVDEVFEVSREELKNLYNIDVMDQFGFNNTYVMAIKPETAEEYDLYTLSDLQKVADGLVAGVTTEFMSRDDGMPALKEHYGLEFKDEISVEGSNKYLAIMNGETDITNAFATDGLLVRHGLIRLEDDDGFFPPYFAVPLAGSGVLDEYPELIDVMAELGNVLTDDVMASLNYEIDEEGRDPREVSYDFLTSEGLISN